MRMTYQTHEVISAHGSACLIANWNGLRYISRSARSLTSPARKVSRKRMKSITRRDILLIENLENSHMDECAHRRHPSCIPFKFLVIGDVVLDGRSDTFGLHAIDVGSSNQTV